eukprot:snap_masked-scaffold_18-processed-gene-2.35-mRNA-1 protein AED:1.00 eAED:1.00 QI:0/0/0/0/1/1/2/0/61
MKQFFMLLKLLLQILAMMCFCNVASLVAGSSRRNSGCENVHPSNSAPSAFVAIVDLDLEKP